MFVPNGLARAAVRFKPSSFAGTFVALLMTAAIVSACGILLETGSRATVPPVRYSGAPVVVAADQQVRYTVGRGEDEEHEYVQVPDKARLDNSLVAKAASAPGAARAIGDVTFPVRTEKGTLTAHGWASSAFTGASLSAGSAPGTGEVVATAGSGMRVGDRARLETPGGTKEFRVSGLASTHPPAVEDTREGSGTVWFADAQALALSARPRTVDAVVVLPEPGTGTAALAAQAKRLIGGRALVHTGDDRGAVEDPGLPAAKETLAGLGGSFGGIATMVAVFTASGTVALAVGLRRREFALLRAIGATPRQIRRTIATEAILVAPLAGVLGCLPGIALAGWWFGRLKDKGAIPEAVDLAVSWVPLVWAAGIVIATALFAGYLAARRPSRIKPGQALAEASVERIGIGWIRTPLGIAAVVGGVVCAGLAAHEKGEDAANAALGVVMLFMLAVALLGPLVARFCAGLFGLPLRAAGAAGSLAAANSRTNARRLASAITPIVLAMAFSSVLVFLHTSEDRAAAQEQRDGITADHVVSAPQGLPVDASERAAATRGVLAAVSLLRTSVLVPTGSGGDELEAASAQGVSGRPADFAKVQDLDVRTGSMAGLAPGTVALDRALADRAKVRTGDRLPLRLPDGTKASPRIVALYGRGMGLPQVTLPVAALTGHVTAPYPQDLLVRATPAAAGKLSALGTVSDKEGYTSARSLDRELNAWANTTMAAVLGGFAAVAAANTLVMTVLDRRRELGMLRLVGSTRRQVIRMIHWEALLVGLAGVGLGTGIAMATLIPMTRGLTGKDPYIPPTLYGSFVAAILLLGLTAATVPARAALRRRGP